MKKIAVTIGILSSFLATAQDFVINPYLQNASPTSMVVMWEMSSWDTSYVSWGTTPDLGDVDSTTYEVSLWPAYIFTAKLNNLTPNTHYYYKVTTGSTSSNIFDFYTPALADDEQSFSLVAVSDMQMDYGNPTKFQEVIHDGIIAHIEEDLNGTINEEVDMMLVPGDLVDWGTDYYQWEDQFFGPADPLFSYIPVYPVLGNHEVNTAYFFQYFNLPENGTPGYEEHWYVKDNSNVRIIGLDSNYDYQIQEQLDWLDSVLTATENDAAIDFVFAQLHHPHESELWIAGNTDFTGEVIELLEKFTEESGKPSVHFFGHTHGYSRGQSKNHKHLMVNVASAGGHIDYWGEYAQNDYEEYTISQDEYGYVYVDIEAGDDPQFTLKRYSIGDANVIKNNTLEDSVTIRLNNISPTKPTPIFPTNTDTVLPDCVVLLADDFVDDDGDEHGASQWQISNDCSDFTSPVFDQWRQYENWYFEINTQAGDDLTDEEVNVLEANNSYCWRVRYRDKGLGWSEWSNPTEFYTTDGNHLSDNLLLNPGAEDGVNDWVVENDYFESLTEGECNGEAPYTGDYYFSVGGLCETTDFGSAYQIADISEYATEIDAGTTAAIYGAFMDNWGGDDIPAVALQFLDNNNDVIFATDTTTSTQQEWTLIHEQWGIPSGTRQIKYILMGTRNAGNDNDSYVDDAFLKVNLSADSCSYYIPGTSTNVLENELHNLKLYPNPMRNSALLNIPYKQNDHLQLKVYNMQGQMVKNYQHVHPPTFTLQKEGLSNGVYLLQLLDKQNVIGSIRFGVID